MVRVRVNVVAMIRVSKLLGSNYNPNPNPNVTLTLIISTLTHPDPNKLLTLTSTLTLTLTPMLTLTHQTKYWKRIYVRAQFVSTRVDLGKTIIENTSVS